jgi:shikimate dehydrogenase
MVTALTKPTFLIGNPVSHSKSPIFQNAGFQHSKINSTYLAVNVEKENFKKVMIGFKLIDIYGMNVTIPYKTSIIEFVDELSEEAKKIGAINTIEVVNKKWIGHNTDWYGVLKTLENNKVSNKLNVLIIGAGGAANGVIYGLQKYGIKNIAITNRSIEKAVTIKEQFKVELVDYNDYRNRVKFYSMIINATSINFNELVDNFENEKIYFDLKYYSEKIKARNFIDGSDMLLYQGIKSFEIWTKKEAPLEVMRNAIK